MNTTVTNSQKELAATHALAKVPYFIKNTMLAEQLADAVLLNCL